MARRKKATVAEHTHLDLKVTDYSAHVDASINYSGRDPRHYKQDAQVYEFHSVLEIQAGLIYPEERGGCRYELSVHGYELYPGEFARTLADCHVRDSYGVPKYRKARGKEVPVYDVPKGIGHLDRLRGTEDWLGWAWVSPQTVTNMLTLLPHVSPLYVELHELRVGRHRWIVGLTLQTTDPVEE